MKNIYVDTNWILFYLVQGSYESGFFLKNIHIFFKKLIIIFDKIFDKNSWF